MQIIERVVSIMQRYTELPKKYNDELLKHLAYFVDNYGAGLNYENVCEIYKRDLYLHDKNDEYELYQLEYTIYDIPITDLTKKVLNIGA